MTTDIWVDATVTALAPLADDERAAPMRAYMKDVAPFLGIPTPSRRAALRAAWRGLPDLSPADVASVTRALWSLPEREYQYAACDLLERRQRRLAAAFLVDPVQDLLVTKPWWDTVDSLGTAAICPITARHPESVDLMWQWLESGDRWLIRAAIQHQRGRKADTDFPLLYAMCDRLADDREFFIAKAIGWALRETSRWDREGVHAFVDGHPELSAVARREALRGLDRSSRP